MSKGTPFDVFNHKFLQSDTSFTYSTEPIYIGGYERFIAGLTVHARGTNTRLFVQVMGTDNPETKNMENWTMIGSPHDISSGSPTTYYMTYDQLPSYIRISARVSMVSGSGTSYAEVSLRGHLFKQIT